MSDANREKQIAEAEALLADGPEEIGPAKGLFFGRYLGEQLPPYPGAPDAATEATLAKLRDFCQQHIDPVAIDRNAEIPPAVIRGLGELGVLGACLPVECGGKAMPQAQYCRILETLGGHCASTALFVNAHHSIGPRALVLFGNDGQKSDWLPKLATGEWISAFALTEPEAGSDASNVQTTATPVPERGGYVLNGEKRWITNGGIAQVLTVMARTPLADRQGTAISAFLVTPDMPGFEVVEQRMDKMGVRGTATSRLAFHEMFVPEENLLGELGRGLKIALTVLDFGRTTFGASCTGAAKYCLQRCRRHVRERVQFGQPIGSFELVKAKLAAMAAGVYATEAVTYQTAALIDSGVGDYMIETAMLKVFSTDVLWRILDDTFQIHGGLAYFNDEPFERMIRDARINTIGEGSNDVLRAFIALVGMRDVGMQLKEISEAIVNPLANLGRLGGFASRRLARMVSTPNVHVRSSELADDAARVGKLIGKLASNIERLLARYREEIVDRQYQQGRIADSATELYVCCCVLARMDQELCQNPAKDSLRAGRYYLRSAERRITANLRALWDNDDSGTTELADALGAE